MGSGEGWTDLQELTKVLNTDPGKIDRILDVDNALWMLALNNVMVNLSSYSGNHSINYYLYKDGNGRFQVVPWDLNLAFGSYKNTGSGSDLELKGPASPRSAAPRRKPAETADQPVAEGSAQPENLPGPYSPDQRGKLFERQLRKTRPRSCRA